MAVDPKAASVQCLKQNLPESVCIFSRLTDLIQAQEAGGSEEAFCQRHNQFCPCQRPEDGSVSALIIGFPCSPFSAQRPGRYSPGSGWPHTHLPSNWLFSRKDQPKFSNLENTGLKRWLSFGWFGQYLVALRLTPYCEVLLSEIVCRVQKESSERPSVNRALQVDEPPLSSCLQADN